MKISQFEHSNKLYLGSSIDGRDRFRLKAKIKRTLGLRPFRESKRSGLENAPEQSAQKSAQKSEN